MEPLDLCVVEGSNRGRFLRLDSAGSFVIGRDPQAALVLEDDLVSRHHARLDVTEHGIQVADLGSINGTRVNGSPAGPAALAPGDTLEIGRQKLRLEPAEATRAQVDSTTVLVAESAERLGRRRPELFETDRIPVQPGAGAILPRAIGPYRILSRLATGGMGVVYVGVRKEPSGRGGEEVAVKTLKPKATLSDEMRQRFLQEIQVNMRLEHPHIVRFLDAGSHAGVPYMVCELVKGWNVHVEIQERNPIEISRIAAWLGQLSGAVAYAHGQRIIHRDLKPSNVVIEDGTDSLRILDFGLGRALDASDTRQTLTGETMGTIPFISPEQLEDASAADERSDVYGIGALLYTLLAGAPPFTGAGRFQLVDRILKSPPDPIAERRPDTPSWMVEIVEVALAKKPDQRFQTAEEIALRVRKRI